MKKLFALFALSGVCVSATAAAHWERITSATDNTAERFIDPTAIRQTGPMNTMRRVWELSNLNKGASGMVLSTKNYVEYDCKNRRVRVIEETSFSEHWAQGEELTLKRLDAKPGNWSDIGKGSVSDKIFNRICPNDD